MIRALVLASAILAPTAFAAGAARAQDGAPPSPEMLDAALQAAIAQRDQALNEGVRVSAQLSLARREIARLRRELDQATRPASSPPRPRDEVTELAQWPRPNSGSSARTANTA